MKMKTGFLAGFLAFLLTIMSIIHFGCAISSPYKEENSQYKYIHE